MASLSFILRRARRHWQILLTLCLGVILATALLASGPLLVDTVTEMGLHLTLQGASVVDGNLRLVTATRLDQAGFQNLDSEIQTLLHDELGEHLGHVPWSVESEWMVPWVDGQSATDQRVNLRSYEGIRDRVEYVSGGWPARASSEPNVIRVVISDYMARQFVLRVGDRLPLSLAPESAEPDGCPLMVCDGRA